MNDVKIPLRSGISNLLHFTSIVSHNLSLDMVNNFTFFCHRICYRKINRITRHRAHHSPHSFV